MKELALRPSEHVQLSVLLANRSSQSLFSNSDSPVYMSYHWLTQNGDCTVWDGLRTELPRTLGPDETIEVSVNVLAPETLGKFDLALTLVKEGHYWFEEKNPSVPIRISVEVTLPEAPCGLPLSNLSFLSFEIGPGCQLGEEHPECPINRQERHPERSFGHLRPELIARAIDEARGMGFQGWVAFHYYNEPLLYMKSILDVMEMTAYDKYLLWTNGLLLEKYSDHLDRFHTIHVTDYELPENPDFQALMARHPKVNWIVRKITLDARLEVLQPARNNVVCTRPEYCELPIDYYGNIHMCCYDWSAEVRIGNIIEQDFANIIKSPGFQSILAELRGGDNPPAICKRCLYPTQAVKWEH